jgi:hypothetical protein
MFHETWRMEKMFKKTLLALAIAGTAFTASADLAITAGGVGATAKGQLISAEGVANTTSLAPAAVTATVSGTLTNYASMDKIRVTITGGTLTPATSVAVAYNKVAGSGTSVANLATLGAVTYPDTTTALIDLVTADEDQIDGDTGTIAATDTFVITGLDITPTSIAVGAEITYKIEVLSSVGGAVIDTKTGVVATVVNQFASKVSTKFGTNEIDVGDDRLSFVASPTNVLADALTVDITSAQVDHAPASAVGEVLTTVLGGSFGFLDADASGAVDTGSVTTATTSPAVAADFSTVTEAQAAFGAGIFDGLAADAAQEVYTITVDGTDHVIAPQTFSVDVDFDYADAATKAGSYTTTLSGGAWTLNGASAYIPFMPFSSAFSQAVTIANSGAVAGAVTVDWVYAGTTVSTPLTIMAAGKSVTDISTQLRAAAAANGVTGNAALTIVVNSPNADIQVKALYYSKADKDRGIVL